jgi:uncharacterized membrane protein YesL
MDYKNKQLVILLSSFFEFIYLNLLWLLFSIPLITIFSSTTAMFGVIRKWKLKQEIEIFSTFKSIFKENFLSSTVLGLFWMLFLLLIIMDFRLINNLSSQLQLIGFAVLGIMVVLFLFTSSYLFSVLVHFDANLFGVIKNAFLLSVLSPFTTLIKMVLVLLCAYLVFRIPVSLFLIGSIGAYYLYSVDHRLFEKYEKPKKFSLDS